MKKLLFMALLAITATAQAEPTAEQCQGALTLISIINAYNLNCGGSGLQNTSTDLQMLSMYGCHDKLSLNQIRGTLAGMREFIAQERYKANSYSFCANKDLNNAYLDAVRGWSAFEGNLIKKRLEMLPNKN